MNSIRDLQVRAYKQSIESGFHDDEPLEGRGLLSLNAERIALMHSELSEALEELRKGRPAHETYYAPPFLPSTLVAEVGVSRAMEIVTEKEKGQLLKPEGVPSEMADTVIRIMDFCGANGIDLEGMILQKLDYNATRSHKHGGKKF